VPRYDYACAQCDHRFEAVQSFSDEPLTECPVCGGRLRKLISPVGVVFKGSGFYRNDSRPKEPVGAGESSSSDAKAKSDGKADAKSGTKATGTSDGSSTGKAPAAAAPTSGSSTTSKSA
jgi:putative FmdB family regulatory protein